MLSFDLTNSFCIYCCGSIAVKRSSMSLSLTQTSRLEYPVEYSDRLWSSEWWNQVSARVGVRNLMLSCDLTYSFCTFCFGSITIKCSSISLSCTQTRRLEYQVEYCHRL
jgi:hypothetical protein